MFMIRNVFAQVNTSRDELHDVTMPTDDVIKCDEKKKNNNVTQISDRPPAKRHFRVENSRPLAGVS